MSLFKKPLTPEEKYRKQRMAELMEFWDQWVIDTPTLKVGDEPAKQVFVPHPLWDDEWMLTREHFASWTEARSEVMRRGGKILKGQRDVAQDDVEWR